jgi:hypothetical protein
LADYGRGNVFPGAVVELPGGVHLFLYLLYIHFSSFSKNLFNNLYIIRNLGAFFAPQKTGKINTLPRAFGGACKKPPDLKQAAGFPAFQLL